MHLQVTNENVIHDYEIQCSNDFFIVRWEQLSTGNRDDIRHKVSVYIIDNSNPLFLEGSIIFVHKLKPTEKRSKKHLRNVLSEIKATA